MGKKASFKHDLSYEADLYDDYQHSEEEDNEYLLKNDPRHSLTKWVPPQPLGKQPKKKANAKRDAAPNIQVLKRTDCPLYYKSNFLPRPFCTLNEDTVIHMAKFLPMRSIASLGCVNRFIHNVLEKDFLYCRPSKNENKNLLPCLHRVRNHLPPLESCEKGLARSFAMEACAFTKSNFPMISSIKAPIQNFYIGHGGKLSIVSESCELSTGGIRGTRTTTKIPGCDRLVGSDFHEGKCAVMTVPSKGVRRYVIDFIGLPRSGAGTTGLERLWQRDVEQALFSPITTPPSVSFNNRGDRVLVQTPGRSAVLSCRGETMWEMNSATVNACAIHNDFVMTLEKTKLQIFDIRSKALAASGTLPKRCFSNMHTPKTLLMFGGRVWLAGHPSLLCTERILQKLQNDTFDAPWNLQIFNYGRMDTHRPILACNGNYMYLAQDTSIRRFDRRKLSAPCTVYTTQAPIDTMIVDETKILCSTKDSSKYGIEILPVYNPPHRPSLSVKKATCFKDKSTIQRMRCRRNLLAVSYAHRHTSGSGAADEIRIFDLASGIDS